MSGVRYEDHLAGLPAAERAAVERGTARLLAEDAALTEIRAVAVGLPVDAGAVAAVDRLLAGLRAAIAPAGGRLEIVLRTSSKGPSVLLEEVADLVDGAPREERD